MINFNEIKNVLILAPHTDDGEFGCGGSIVKLIDSGAEVYYGHSVLVNSQFFPTFQKIY